MAIMREFIGSESESCPYFLGNAIRKPVVFRTFAASNISE